MATVSRTLPERPHLDIPKREARALLVDWREGKPEALERIRHQHSRAKDDSHTAFAIPDFKLSDAQRVIAREYGFASWTALKQRIAGAGVAGELLEAIQGDDRATAIRLLRAHPALLHVPLWSGNWGLPLSHAANLGRLEIMAAIAELGARDHQHAFGRAVLQGRIDCARWLLAHGAKLTPGIIMGPCETLNASGFGFLVELGAPLADATGNRLAPLAGVLETYTRNPAAKHAILGLFAAHGHALPDTPMMAFHHGDLARLREFVREDPKILERRFGLREIFPVECGCSVDGRAGMHWTPVDGTTLLHLAIDFREREIFDWLLAEKADVNAAAMVDGEGFGGHTPLFHTVVNGPQYDASYAAALLRHGADRAVRANVRKFLDWCEQPRWHEARNVTAAEWGATFPDPGWVNLAALALLR